MTTEYGHGGIRRGTDGRFQTTQDGAERCAAALRLYSEGMRYVDIAAALGYSAEAGARAAV